MDRRPSLELECMMAGRASTGMSWATSSRIMWPTRAPPLTSSAIIVNVMGANWMPPTRRDAADVEKYVEKKFFTLEPDESVTAAGSQRAEGIHEELTKTETEGTYIMA